MAIDVQIDTPPTPPSSVDKTNFRIRYDAFLAYIQALAIKLITFIQQINLLEENVNAKEASATASATAAAASANFQGTWTNQTTVVGQSWLFNGVIYRVLVAGNTSPVTSPSNWQAISPVYGKLTKTFSTAANAWYRIATSAININQNDGEFVIRWSVSGSNGAINMNASITNGLNPCLSQASYTIAGSGITQARIVYHTTATGNYAYLEVMFNAALTNVVVSVEGFDLNGWSLIAPNTAGSIPGGYTSLTYSFKSTVTAGTYKSVTVDSDGSVVSGTNPTTLSGFGITDAVAKSNLLEMMIVEDQKASGTAAGASVVGINTRTLNTVVYNGISGASLASNQVTLPAGTYRIQASAPMQQSQNSQLLLKNVSDATYAKTGKYNHSSTTASYGSTESTLDCVVTIPSQKTFQLDHWISNAQATFGLGAVVSSASGYTVVYASMQITKIG